MIAAEIAAPGVVFVAAAVIAVAGERLAVHELHFATEALLLLPSE